MFGKDKRDLPSIVAEVVEPLRQARQAQNQVIELYHQAALTDAMADHAIMDDLSPGRHQRPAYRQCGGAVGKPRA